VPPDNELDWTSSGLTKAARLPSIGEREKAIRKDPVGTAIGMAKKVFGLVGK
jgi:hypothetical protein